MLGSVLCLCLEKVQNVANFEQLKERIKKSEGLRLKPYKCPAGKTSIGWGRNLEDNGISKEEAEFLLNNDIDWAISECSQHEWYQGDRKSVV